MTSFKAWNLQQKRLQSLLRGMTDLHQTVLAISRQHQLAHASAMCPTAESTFEDALWNQVDDVLFRRIPEKSIYSIAWHLWHSARIEDITANSFITHQPQVHQQFKKRLKVAFDDTGNCMQLEEMKAFNQKIDMEALHEYRIAVGRRTHAAIEKLTFETLNTKVSQDELQLIQQNGYVLPGANWLIAFWGRKTIAGIVLMPLTRHLMVHLNEASRLIPKKRPATKVTKLPGDRKRA